MNTPSKEALDASEAVQDYLGFPRSATIDLAAIIDRHFEQLRRDNATLAGRLTAAELERDGLGARAEQAEARVKELEADTKRLEHENDGLERRRQYETDLVCAAVLEANSRGVSFGSAELCARVDEIRTLRAGLCQKCGGFLEHGHDCDAARKEVKP